MSVGANGRDITSRQVTEMRGTYTTCIYGTIPSAYFFDIYLIN